MKIFLVAGALIFSGFLLFPKTGFPQGDAECPASIRISANGEREVVWRDGEGARAGYFWLTGHWQKKSNADGYDWIRGFWEKTRSGWVYIQEVNTGRKSRWVLCSELK